MCGVRREEVFSALKDGRKPMVLKSATERLLQVIAAQNLQAHGHDRIASLELAEKYYEECLNLSDWTDVVNMTQKYLDVASKANNAYLRYLILSLLDVLEEKGQCADDEAVRVHELLAKAFSVRLDFTSSKGLSLKEVYERAGSKEQFMVILRFLADHPRCSGELREAVDTLMKHYDDIKEGKMCA